MVAASSLAWHAMVQRLCHLACRHATCSQLTQPRRAPLQLMCCCIATMARCWKLAGRLRVAHSPSMLGNFTGWHACSGWQQLGGSARTFWGIQLVYAGPVWLEKVGRRSMICSWLFEVCLCHGASAPAHLLRCSQAAVFACARAAAHCRHRPHLGAQCNHGEWAGGGLCRGSHCSVLSVPVRLPPCVPAWTVSSVLMALKLFAYHYPAPAGGMPQEVHAGQPAAVGCSASAAQAHGATGHVSLLLRRRRWH